MVLWFHLKLSWICFCESEGMKKTLKTILTILLSLSRQDLNQYKEVYTVHCDEDLLPNLLDSWMYYKVLFRSTIEGLPWWYSG